MSVQDVLNKIGDRYPEVIGALVCHNGNVHHNLTAPYDIVSADTIMETFSDIFECCAPLEEEGYSFGDMVLDFDSHSFIIRVIEDGLLVVLTSQLQRGQIVKLQVGLGLFARSVADALKNETGEAAPAAPAAAPESAPQVVAKEESKGFGIGFLKKRLGSTTTTQQVVAPGEEPPLGPDGKPRKVRMYRGVAFYD